jgi:hypothetical protein
MLSIIVQPFTISMTLLRICIMWWLRSGNEVYCLLEYDGIYSDRSLLTFRRNAVPPALRWRRKLSMAESSKAGDGCSTFFRNVGVSSQKIVFLLTAMKTRTRTGKFYRASHSYQRKLSSPTGWPRSDQRRIAAKHNVFVSLLQNVSFWGMIKGRNAWHPAKFVTKPKHLNCHLVLCCH